MRALLALLVAAPAIAQADAIAEGQELAKKGQYAQALAKFKDADRRTPRAETACLIGLAHLRGGHAPEAEARFAECRARAQPGDPVPEWLDAVEAQLATELAKLVPIAIESSTSDPIEISGWRDDPITAHAIHLPRGHYTVTSGTASRELEVEDEPVTVRLDPARTKARSRRASPSHSDPTHTSTYVLGAAAGFAAIGVGLHVFGLSPARDTLSAEVDPGQYARDLPAYSDMRIAVVSLYAAAAIALGVGLYLRHGEMSVAATVIPGGGSITLAWHR